MGLFSMLRKNKQSVADDSGPTLAAASVAPDPSADEPATSSPARNRRKSPSSDRRPRADAAVDPMLPEKKRARRRLIGSVALALALVIVLPMVLDTEPKPLPTDIAIQIPARDAPENHQPLRRAPAVSPLVLPEEDDPVEEIIELPSTPKRVPLHAAAKPAQEAPVKRQEQHGGTGAEKPSIDRVSLKPVAEAEAPGGREKRPSADAVGSKDRTSDEGKREAAKTGLDKKVEKAAKADRIVLQVAALASMDKATELQNRLADAGVRSYTQKVATGSGERIRIRVGPYSNQEEADKARAKLAVLGLNGTVVSN